MYTLGWLANGLRDWAAERATVPFLGLQVMPVILQPSDAHAVSRGPHEIADVVFPFQHGASVHGASHRPQCGLPPPSRRSLPQADHIGVRSGLVRRVAVPNMRGAGIFETAGQPGRAGLAAAATEKDKETGTENCRREKAMSHMSCMDAASRCRSFAVKSRSSCRPVTPVEHTPGGGPSRLRPTGAARRAAAGGVLYRGNGPA